MHSPSNTKPLPCKTPTGSLSETFFNRFERFWYNRFAGNRIRFFERLQKQVTETLSLGNPLEQK
jgi:hypothetical protein